MVNPAVSPSIYDHEWPQSGVERPDLAITRIRPLIALSSQWSGILFLSSSILYQVDDELNLPMSSAFRCHT